MITLPAGMAAARAEIDSQFGPIPSGLLGTEVAALNAARDQLAFSIASMGPYLVTATVVNPGQPVQVDTSSGAGATIAPGTIS